MKDKCIDTGTIQAFTDGELGFDASERLLKHVAVCSGCAALLSECEEESALAFSLLDEELNVLVPTERLRSKVFASIDEYEGRHKAGWLAELSAFFSFNSPGLTVAAGALIIAGVIAIGIGFFGSSSVDGPVAAIRKKPAPVRTENKDSSQPVPVDVPARPEVASADPGVTARHRKSNASRRSTRVPKTEDGRTRPPVRPVQAVASSRLDSNIVSEDSYLQTIATLDRSVKYNKELLRPSERVAFERDLAVVNNAIVKMKEEVRRNPDNQAAREVLNASYQNKVDLLNSVAEKTELMASLQ